VIAIDAFMTRNPVSLPSDATVADAWRQMGATGCRHLPVVRAGKVIGIVSQRSLYRLETVARIDRSHEPVMDAMEEALLFAPGAPLAFVARAMAEGKHGAAIVVEDARPVGIFTSVDGLRALAGLLGASEAERAELAAALTA